MGPRLVHDMLHVLESTARDDAVKAMVITGAGRGFCAGADVSGGRSAQELGRELDEADSYRRHRAAPVGHFGVLFEALSSWPKPIIAAVNGAAAGAGMSLALVCDIRIASTEARFISAFVHRAINPDTGSTWYLPQMLGKGRALEMMYTGEPLSRAGGGALRDGQPRGRSRAAPARGADAGGEDREGPLDRDRADQASGQRISSDVQDGRWNARPGVWA